MLEHVSDRQRARIGLALVSVAVVVAAVLFALLESVAGRSAMVAIVVFGVVRGWLLYRSVRGTGQD